MKFRTNIPSNFRPSLTVCKCKCRMPPAVSFCIIICTKIFFAPYRSQIIFTNNVPFQLFFSYDTLNFVTLSPKDCLSPSFFTFLSTMGNSISSQRFAPNTIVECINDRYEFDMDLYSLYSRERDERESERLRNGVGKN